MTKNSERMTRDRDRALLSLNRLSDVMINELVRRAGTRATTDMSRSTGPRGKGDHSDPTLLSVVRSMSKHKVQDPVYDATQELAKILLEMAKLAMRADEKVKFVLEVRERAKEAEITYCKQTVEGGCGREVMNTPNDRLRSGLCGACYQAQRRAPIPYYVQVTTIHNNSESPDKLA